MTTCTTAECASEAVRFTTDCGGRPLGGSCRPAAAPGGERRCPRDIRPKEGGKIHIRARLQGKNLVLTVADTGCGIEADRLEEIRRALACGDEEKTGVGLGNISRRIQSMYPGGELAVYSAWGKGTVIRILLPEK